MQVGVPGRDQWHPEFVGQHSAQEAAVTGAGDVDEIRTKARQRCRQLPPMPEKEQIEGQIGLQWNNEATGLKLIRFEFMIDNMMGLGTGVHEKERMFAFLGKARKFAAGLGYSIHLAEAVGEKRYARYAHSANSCCRGTIERKVRCIPHWRSRAIEFTNNWMGPGTPRENSRVSERTTPSSQR